jgi:hypothetical protein
MSRLRRLQATRSLVCSAKAVLSRKCFYKPEYGGRDRCQGQMRVAQTPQRSFEAAAQTADIGRNRNGRSGVRTGNKQTFLHGHCQRQASPPLRTSAALEGASARPQAEITPQRSKSPGSRWQIAAAPETARTNSRSGPKILHSAEICDCRSCSLTTRLDPCLRRRGEPHPHADVQPPGMAGPDSVSPLDKFLYNYHLS